MPECASASCVPDGICYSPMSVLRLSSTSLAIRGRFLSGSNVLKPDLDILGIERMLLVSSRPTVGIRL